MLQVKPLHSLMLAGMIAMTSQVSAKPVEETYSLRDPGVINKERIIYWLKENGALAQNASEEQIEAAYSEYVRNTKGYKEPVSIKVWRDKALKNVQAKRKSQKNDDTTKTVNVLSVLVDFPDLPHDDNRLNASSTQMYYPSYPVEHYQQMQFSTNGYEGPSGQTLKSAHQYYQEVSGGSFFFNGQTFGWVTADNNAAEYGGNEGQNDNDRAVRDLVAEAVQKAVTANNIDLSEFDIEDPYDRDGDGDVNEPDGFIDHIMIYHSSVGEEAGGGVLGANAIWSHRWSINQTGNFNTMGVAIQDGTCNDVDIMCKRAFGYTVQPIDAAIGVVVHEFGHDLGLLDEYDIEYSANGVGSPVGHWSVMGAGGWTGSPGGTNPTGFSPLATDFFQTYYGGKWINQEVYEFENLTDTEISINLAEAVEHGDQFTNQVRIDLPGESYAPYTGSFQYYSGEGDQFTHTMSFNVAIPSGSAAELTMKANWDIEVDYDYVQVLVDGTAIAGNRTLTNNQYYPGIGPYITGTSASIPGAEGDIGWVDTTFDVTAYAGQTVTISIQYVTDQAVGGYGFVVDDIAVNVDGSQAYFDGAETAAATLNGFSQIENRENGGAGFYYIQLRSHNGNDSGLGPFGYGAGVTVWYRNDEYEDNVVGTHPGYGFIGIVDADQNNRSGRDTWQLIRDAAFTVDGISVFNDTNDYSTPVQPESGLVLPAHGFRMQVMSQAADSSTATIAIRQVGAAPTADFTTSVSGATVTLTSQATGGTGSLSYLWEFGDGNSSTDANTSHTYSTSGQYEITLTVTDEAQSSTVIRKNVNVTVSTGGNGGNGGGSGGGGGSLPLAALALLVLARLRKRTR
ncbi:MAG: immune inhibitor A [Gammaproteobacteria bacterium]|nr:immune inhibitor A [Gammaproteobacteria bacterium]